MNKQNLRIKFGLSFLLLFFILFTGYSQEQMPVNEIKSDWTFFKEVKGIKFYVKKEFRSIDQSPQPLEYFVVKIENNTSKDVKLLYNFGVISNFGCTGCETSENRQLIELKKNSTIQGDLNNWNYALMGLLVNPNIKNGLVPESITLLNLIIN